MREVQLGVIEFHSERVNPGLIKGNVSVCLSAGDSDEPTPSVGTCYGNLAAGFVSVGLALLLGAFSLLFVFVVGIICWHKPMFLRVKPAAEVSAPQDLQVISVFHKSQYVTRIEAFKGDIPNRDSWSVREDKCAFCIAHGDGTDYYESDGEEGNYPRSSAVPPIGRRIIVALVLACVGSWFLYGDRWAVRDDNAGIWIGGACWAVGLLLLCLTGYHWTWSWWL